VPVNETGAGVVHCFFDAEGDLAIGPAIIDNAKTRRCSVCNALDCLIIHAARLGDLPTLCAPLATKGVKIHADARAYEALRSHYPDELLTTVANEEEWHTEWLSLQMGIKTVDSLDEALNHIDTYGSGHSESIVTENEANARRYQAMVERPCALCQHAHGASPMADSWAGAEIGISHAEAGARAPWPSKR
jgi:glutamate-5-semialdehyde dehydrogenase